MKQIYKKLLLIATFALSVVGAEAKLIDFGISAGTTISNYSIPGLNDYLNNKGGFQVGAQASLSLPIISVTPEVWYTQSGFTIDDLFGTKGEYADVKVQAVDLPVVVGISLFKILTLEAGPRFALSTKTTTTVLGEDIDVENFRSSVGYVAGAKVTLLNKIFVGARYNGEFGTSDFGFDNYGIKSESLSIFAGYKF